MNFLDLTDKTMVVVGVANRRSVAYAIAKVLEEAGARIIYVVRDESVRTNIARLVGDALVLCCDVEDEAQIAVTAAEIGRNCDAVHGLVHSIAFANYSNGFGAFHQTRRGDFLQAMQISCFSLVELVNHLKPYLHRQAAIVTISISTTRMAAENYGYMAPIKAALDSTVVFLAKSLSADSEIRVNAVGAGLLKTSASAGIPGYVDSYLYAEQLIPRRRALATAEVADAAAFLLSPRASGITAQTIIVDAGMSINYFDQALVKKATACSE